MQTYDRRPRRLSKQQASASRSMRSDILLEVGVDSVKRLQKRWELCELLRSASRGPEAGRGKEQEIRDFGEGEVKESDTETKSEMGLKERRRGSEIGRQVQR
eukprot:183518-Pleurochrysis_carterae.AAC.1